MWVFSSVRWRLTCLRIILKVIHLCNMSRLDYCSPLYYGLHPLCLHHLELVQNAAACTSTVHVNTSPLHWLPVSFRIQCKIFLLISKTFKWYCYILLVWAATPMLHLEHWGHQPSSPKRFISQPKNQRRQILFWESLPLCPCCSDTDSM